MQQQRVQKFSSFRYNDITDVVFGLEKKWRKEEKMAKLPSTHDLTLPGVYILKKCRDGGVETIFVP